MRHAARRRAHALAIALCVLGACVPALNTRGRIACGDAGECPQGFECRTGRCCPVDAGASCPAPDDASADAGDGGKPDGGPVCGPDMMPNEGCGADDECRQGVCCARTAGTECPAGAAGAACEGTDDCFGVRSGGNRFCLMMLAGSNAPGGYCSADCDPSATDDVCAPLGVCVGRGTMGSCLRLCNNPGESCRDTGGYRCTTVARNTTETMNLCLPDCTSTDPPVTCDTMQGATCYARSHSCEVACGVATDGGVDLCTTRLSAAFGCDPRSHVCLVRCGPALPACLPGTTCELGFCQPSM